MEKVNLTDQELNEWVGVFIMRFYIKSLNGNAFYFKDRNGECVEFSVNKSTPTMITAPEFFNPCVNLNHAHLMENKISETKYYSEKRKYFENACRLIGAFIGKEKDSGKNVHADFFKLLCLSARKRCEAAWLTFNEED